MERISKYVAAMCQFAPTYCNFESNLGRICAQAEAALKQEKDTRLVAFPETATMGSPGMPKSHDEFWKLEAYVEMAEPADGPTANALGKLSKAYQAYIACGFVEKSPTLDGVIYNSVLLMGPDGEIAALHRKVQTGDMFKAGDSVAVHDTAIGKIGLSICYDLWFPEFMRVQVMNGCEVHVNVTANQPIFGIGSTHVPIVRAVESGVFVVSVNMIGDQRTDGGRAYMGASSIISPFGEIIAQAGQQSEETIFGEIDLRRITKMRTLIATVRDVRSDLYEVVYHPPANGERLS